MSRRKTGGPQVPASETHSGGMIMYFEEFEVGMKWDIGETQITRAQMLEYAERYDSAPVHFDEEYGKRCRFGDIIAPGTMTALRMVKQFQEETDIQGEEFIKSNYYFHEWSLPVMSDDILHGVAHIDELEVIDDKTGRVLLKIDTYNQDDKYVMTTTYETVFKRREK